jgi:hypothetical protein
MCTTFPLSAQIKGHQIRFRQLMFPSMRPNSTGGWPSLVQSASFRAAVELKFGFDIEFGFDAEFDCPILRASVSCKGWRFGFNSIQD